MPHRGFLRQCVKQVFAWRTAMQTVTVSSYRFNAKTLRIGPTGWKTLRLTLWIRRDRSRFRNRRMTRHGRVYAIDHFGNEIYLFIEFQVSWICIRISNEILAK